MAHLKVCKHCGLREDEHHDYEPSMPDGCVCPPGEWGSRVNDVCHEFMGGGADCARCQHDEECHKGPNVEVQRDSGSIIAGGSPGATGSVALVAED